jgi:hypothetical protein
MSSGLPGSKLIGKYKMSLSPGSVSLSAVTSAVESKTLFHARNKKAVAERTQNVTPTGSYGFHHRSRASLRRPK